MTDQGIGPFQDRALIYHSQDDGCWIAHSLRTDQIGTGVDMGKALADLIHGIDQLLELAKDDQTISVFREAPDVIQARAASSKPLPTEIYEVAYKLARGEWPSDIEPSFQAADDGEEFSAIVCEKVG